MMLPTLFTTLLLAACTVAQLAPDVVIPTDIQTAVADRSRTENIEDIVRSYINELDSSINTLSRRQGQPGSFPSPSSFPADSLRSYLNPRLHSRQSDSSSPNNLTSASSTWAATTLSACTSALSMLRSLSSSPSGMAFCYNLPFLDNSTGVFQADLRLFTISPPTGDFANVAPKDVAVAVHYVGATVQGIAPSALSTRDLDARRYPLVAWPPARRADNGAPATLRRRDDVAPVLAQSYAFIGQINKDLLTGNLNSTALQALLVPIVTLSIGSTATNSTLSPLEATFVTGLFSDQAKVMAMSPALVAVANEVFVVPGMRISIAPIGAIVTGVWTAALVGVVGWGTVGRMGFRENYRRRKARADGLGMGTI